MFDIGLGEILLLGAIGLLVFGPERLPKAAADAGRMIRNLRAMAQGARKDLADSAGLDLAETQEALSSLRELHPRRIASSLFDDDDTDPVEPTARPGGASGSPERRGPAYDPDAT